ncbi:MULTISPECIES: hypothetical protein [Pseudomonas]|uniref:hypothetical protein n=1 Tax=Pseudomonas TaxID=286 RepID=UPI002234E019|nr:MULTISPECIES: hypothetical protein [Pseudomonas]MDP9514032.1 hypothetical protein [Pseudomonas protegens]UZE37630.1 hypothetical protein LOY69_14390 [Pseudomonas sp. B21-059]
MKTIDLQALLQLFAVLRQNAIFSPESGMAMQILPLLDFFPLSEGEHDPREVALHAQRVKLGWPGVSLRPRLVANNALEFANHAAITRGAGGNIFTHELERKLNTGVYRSWLSCMPTLSASPQTEKYRDCKHDTEKLDLELASLPTLCAGQKLFHGGHWPGKLQVGATIGVDRAFSTTLNAYRAAWFSDEAQRKNGGEFHLWVITISSFFISPVYVYSTFSNRRTGHEMEVLIRRGFKAVLTAIDVGFGYKILHVEFS